MPSAIPAYDPTRYYEEDGKLFPLPPTPSTPVAPQNPAQNIPPGYYMENGKLFPLPATPAYQQPYTVMLGGTEAPYLPPFPQQTVMLGNSEVPTFPVQDMYGGMVPSMQQPYMPVAAPFEESIPPPVIAKPKKKRRKLWLKLLLLLLLCFVTIHYGLPALATYVNNAEGSSGNIDTILPSQYGQTVSYDYPTISNTYGDILLQTDPSATYTSYVTNPSNLPSSQFSVLDYVKDAQGRVIYGAAGTGTDPTKPVAITLTDPATYKGKPTEGYFQIASTKSGNVYLNAMRGMFAIHATNGNIVFKQTDIYLFEYQNWPDLSTSILTDQGNITGDITLDTQYSHGVTPKTIATTNGNVALTLDTTPSVILHITAKTFTNALGTQAAAPRICTAGCTIPVGTNPVETLNISAPNGTVTLSHP